MSTSIVYTYKDIIEEVFKIGFAATKSSGKTKMNDKLTLLYTEFKKLTKGKSSENNDENSDIHKEFEIESKGKFERKDNKKGFRLQRKSVFLTYSDAKNEPKLEDLLTELRHLEKDVRGTMECIGHNMKEIFIVKERHKNGIAHYHVYIEFFERLDKTDSKCLDIPSLKHPEIRYVYCKKKVLQYMCKKLATENDWKYNQIQYEIDIKYELKRLEYALPKIGYDLITGKKTVHEVVTEHPSLIFQGLKLQNNVNWYFEQKANIEKPPMPLKKWSMFGLEFEFDERRKKCPQFWICGPSNVGKTYNTDCLKEKGHRAFLGSKDNDWAGYNDKNFDFMYFEEYQGEMTIRDLNQLLEGTEMKLRGRYEKVIIKNKNMPILINSNYLPHEAYNKVDPQRLQYLLNRIIVIKVEENRQGHIVWNPDINTFKDYDFKMSTIDKNNDFICEICNGSGKLTEDKVWKQDPLR